jgi:hypothetical protein
MNIIPRLIMMAELSQGRPPPEACPPQGRAQPGGDPPPPQTPAASTATGGAGGRGGGIDRHISRQLRAIYDEVVNEPIPEHLTRLLEELERKQGNR